MNRDTGHGHSHAIGRTSGNRQKCPLAESARGSCPGPRRARRVRRWLRCLRSRPVYQRAEVSQGRGVHQWGYELGATCHPAPRPMGRPETSAHSGPDPRGGDFPGNRSTLAGTVGDLRISLPLRKDGRRLRRHFGDSHTGATRFPVGPVRDPRDVSVIWGLLH